MKKHSMPEVKEGNVNVTPLIDIIMCLIVFFMLVAKIGVTTGAEKIDIPTTLEALDALPADAPSHRLRARLMGDIETEKLNLRRHAGRSEERRVGKEGR